MGIRKFTFADIERVEKTLFQWILPKRYRLVLLLFVISMLTAAGFAPYFNLILNFYIIVLVSLVLTPIILNVDSKIFFVVGIVCFFLAALLWFMGQTEEAEVLTEYIFIILLSGSFKAFLSS
ncbi:MAG: hypothetical protein HYU80_02205 [Candidatus Blackburnbacteria bacterium]|nr:hypothetical protein [Candidatus Blackburnbacteria bacterium]